MSSSSPSKGGGPKDAILNLAASVNRRRSNEAEGSNTTSQKEASKSVVKHAPSSISDSSAAPTTGVSSSLHPPKSNNPLTPRKSGKNKPRKSLFQRIKRPSKGKKKKQPKRTSSNPEMKSLSLRNLDEFGNVIIQNDNDDTAQQNATFFSESFTAPRIREEESSPSQQNNAHSRREDDGDDDGDAATTSSGDSSDSVIANMPPPLPMLHLTDRSASVSLESLKRQQTVRQSSRSSNNSASIASSEEVKLNFERIQSTFFSSERKNSPSPQQVLWDAYQRVRNRGEEDETAQRTDDSSSKHHTKKWISSSSGRKMENMQRKDDDSSPPKPAERISSVRSSKTSNVTSQDAAEYMSSLMMVKNSHHGGDDNDSIEHESLKGGSSEIIKQPKKKKKTVETVFIHGASGVGKSFLFENFKQRVVQDRSTVVGVLEATHTAVAATSSSTSHLPETSDHIIHNRATSSFDDNNSTSQRGGAETVEAEPFVAFRSTLGQLFDFLIQLMQQENTRRESKAVSTEMLERLSTKLNDILLMRSSAASRGAVVRYLMKSFPALKKILSFTRHDHGISNEGSDPNIQSFSDDDRPRTSELSLTTTPPADRIESPPMDQDRTTALKQFGLVFVRIFRVVAETLPSVTIVLFIDDLQWAGPESLDLASSLVGETRIENLLFVASFREEESSDALSPYSIVLRKNFHRRKMERFESSGRSAQSTSLLRPSKLVPTQTWSAIRPMTTSFGFQRSSERPKLKKKSRSVERDLADDSQNSAVVPPSTTPLKKAVTLGSYSPPSQRSIDMVSPKGRFSADDTHLLISSPTKSPARAFLGAASPRAAKKTQPSPPSFRRGSLTRALSLIDDDESEDGQDDFPVGEAIPMVPPPISFGFTPSPLSNKTVTTTPPPPPPSLPTTRVRSQSPRFSLSKFRPGSRRNIGTRGGLDKVVEEESGTSPPLPRIATTPRAAEDQVFSAESSSRIVHQLRNHRHGQGNTAVSETIPRNKGSGRSLNRDGSNSSLDFRADDRGDKKRSTLAAGMFSMLPKISIGYKTRSTQLSDYYAGARDVSESTCCNMELPPSPEQLLARFDVSDIPLGVWDEGTICQCISRLLNLESSACKGLAAVVERKTHGNPNSVLRLLDFLHQDGLLYFSLRTYRWEWDEEHIDSVTMATSDVGELLAARIKHLSPESLSVLKVAACIGNSFSAKILEMAVTKQKFDDATDKEEMKFRVTNGQSTCDLKRVLREACDAGLLESGDYAEFRFSHDLIQQNLYSKIEEGNLGALHLKVAGFIDENCDLTASKVQSSAKEVFLCANHYYFGRKNICSERKRLRAIEIHLHASAASRRQCSFRAASIFLERAISEFLARDDWMTNYSTTLEIYSSASEVLSSCGDLERCSQYAHEVIHHARCVQEQLRGHFVFIEVLSTQRRYDEALAEAYSLLATLGCNIPKRMIRFHLYKEYRYLKRKLKGKTLDYFLQLKSATDVADLSILRVMDAISLLLSLKGDNDTGTLLVTKMILITLERGMSVYAPYAVAGFGMLLVSLGDIDEGYRFGELALKMAESFRSKRAMTRTAFLVYTFLSWTRKPLAEGIEVMLNAHRMGLQVGDLEYSSLCLTTYANLYVAVGLPLEPFIDDLRQFLEQLELYNQNQSVAFLLCFYQMSLNLTGNSQTYLSGFRVNDDGEAMQLESFYYRFIPHGDINGSDQGVTFTNLKFATLLLAYVFQDIEELQEWFLVRLFQREAVTLTHFVHLYVTMFSGLAAFSVYRSSRQKWYFRKALSCISVLNGLSKKAGINIMPLLNLLQAERHSFTKDSAEAIKKSYDEAISYAARCGLIHLEAIACERAGDCLFVKRDQYWSQSYYERAVERYTEWGAIAKAEVLGAKISGKKSGEKALKRDSISIAVRGKRRYDPSTWNTMQKADIAEHGSSHRRRNYL